MHVADLWTVPGLWVFRAFVAQGESFDDEAAVQLSPALGAVFWLAVVLAVWALVILVRRRWTVPAAGRSWRINGPWLIGAAWRAQAVHLLLYVLVPLLWEAGRWLLIVAFLPLLVVGFGNKSIASTDGSLNHLRQPACWTFVTVCSGPRSDFLHDRVQNLSGCSVERGCPPPEALVPDFGGWGWKLVWLLLTAAWLAAWRLRPLRR